MEPGAVLKRERTARGISQDGLANMIGKSTSAIAQFEAGRTRMRREVAIAIDVALGSGSTIATAFGFSSATVDVVSLREMVETLALQVKELTERVVELEAARQPAVPSGRRGAPGSRRALA